MTGAIRVVLADDQTVVREGLVTLLGMIEDVEVLGAAVDGEHAVQLVGELAPDVVLMDIHMPRCDGIQATRRIREQHPDVPVVVLSTFADDESVFGALQAGARGYLTKDASAEEIATALRAAHAGQSLLDSAIQQRLVDSLADPSPPSPGRLPSPAALPDQLTAREGEVLTLIAVGLSNAEIATRLYLSQATIKTHINHIFTKIGARDRAQAVAYAYRHRLIPDAS